MSNAENGARIKAFAGPNVGSGIVKNVTFSHFKVASVDNPVIIDQVSDAKVLAKNIFIDEPVTKCYETSAADCASFPSNVYIQDVVFNEYAFPSVCVPAFKPHTFLIAAYRASRLGMRNPLLRHLTAHPTADAVI